jgi:hypothetical protein
VTRGIGETPLGSDVVEVVGLLNHLHDQAEDRGEVEGKERHRVGFEDAGRSEDAAQAGDRLVPQSAMEATESDLTQR